MPYFFAADSKKSKTSLLPLIDWGRSVSAPFSPCPDVSKSDSQEPIRPQTYARSDAQRHYIDNDIISNSSCGTLAVQSSDHHVATHAQSRMIFSHSRIHLSISTLVRLVQRPPTKWLTSGWCTIGWLGMWRNPACFGSAAVACGRPISLPGNFLCQNASELLAPHCSSFNSLQDAVANTQGWAGCTLQGECIHNPITKQDAHPAIELFAISKLQPHIINHILTSINSHASLSPPSTLLTAEASLHPMTSPQPATSTSPRARPRIPSSSRASRKCDESSVPLAN